MDSIRTVFYDRFRETVEEATALWRAKVPKCLPPSTTCAKTLSPFFSSATDLELSGVTSRMVSAF